MFIVWTLIQYMTLHETLEIGANRNHAATSVLVCKQKPYPVWFLRLHKTYPVSCKQSLYFLLNINMLVAFLNIQDLNTKVQKNKFTKSLCFCSIYIFFKTIINWVTNLSRKIKPFNAKWYDAFLVSNNEAIKNWSGVLIPLPKWRESSSEN